MNGGETSSSSAGPGRRDTPADRTPARVVIERRIEWMDTDAAGQHHNTVVTRLVEAAEAVLHTRLGIVGETFGRTPRARTEMNFRAPLRFNDRVRVALWVDEVGRTSLRYGFDVRADRAVAADGALVIVSVDPDRGQPVAWTDRQRELLLTAGDQGEETMGEHTSRSID